MIQDKTFGAVSVDINQFSGEMVIFLVFHVVFLVYDRIIFVCQNRNNLSYEYFFYFKETCNQIPEEEYSQIKSNITKNYKGKKQENFVIPVECIEELQKKYNIVYIQKEEFNIPLLNKYVLHIFITLLAHVWLFFYMPIQGNININNQIYCVEGEVCNDFLYNPFLIICYILYVIYLTGSGLQIKYGFYDMKRKSILKSGNSSINGGIYNGFKAIPFVYEIKQAIDWTFTRTSMDFFQWNKFESVYDVIYSTYCSMSAIKKKMVGQKVGKVLKGGMGGTLSFILVILLVVPLMLFSSLNPTNKENNLTGATLKVDLSFFYKNGAIKNYTLFENSKPESIKDLFPGGEKEWENNFFSESVQTKNFPKEQVQKVQFFTASDRNWGLALPHIMGLINELKKRNDTESEENNDIKEIQFVVEYEFERPLPVEAMYAWQRLEKVIFNKETKNSDEDNKKLDELTQALSECKDIEVTFENIYPVPLRLTANVDPTIITDEKYFNFSDVKLGFTGCKIDEITDEKTYIESYFTFEKITKNQKNPEIKEEEGIVFYVFSDKVSSTTSGYSVLTFYVSFILLAGNYVRNFFAGAPEKIVLTEMPDSQDLIDLCEGIKVSRYSFDFDQEEKLYYILVELMRSPDYLRFMTHSSTEQFKERQEMTKKMKEAEELKF